MHLRKLQSKRLSKLKRREDFLILSLHISIELRAHAHTYIYLLFVHRDIYSVGAARYTTKSTCHAYLLLAPLCLLASHYESTSLFNDRLCPFLTVSLSLLPDPAPFLPPRVTWDLVMMIPARNVHGGPIYRDRESIPVYLRSQWPSPYARIIHSPPEVIRYFFMFQLYTSSLQERFLPRKQYLANIDFGIRFSSFFDSPLYLSTRLFDV